MREQPGTPRWDSVPFMYKQDLREASYDTSRHVVLHWLSSSGSTGPQVLYPWAAADEEVAAATLRDIHPAPETHAGAALVIAPTGLPGMWLHMDRQLRSMGLATVFPGVDSPERIFELTGRLRPQVIISLPLVLSRLGEMRVLRGLPGLAEGGVLFAGGDVLSRARRRRIESFWGAALKNFYGLSEVFGPLACEAEGGEVLVWKSDKVYVEVVDPATKRPVEVGSVGVAVITTLWERPASLVRYWTGDCFLLSGWRAPGQPVFEMRGREQVGLPGLKPGLFPVDVDEVLLSDPAAGNEWSLTSTGEGLTCLVETPQGVEALDLQTKQRLAGMFDAPLLLAAVPPGTLDRSVPKLGVTERELL